MITEITLDAGMIGRAIGFPDGYITTLQQTQSQSPAWQIENFIAIPYPHGRWTSGRLVLRDANRVLFGFSTLHGDVCGVGGGAAPGILMLGASIAYRGDLALECLPRGARWLLQISDAPIPQGVTPLPGGEAPRGICFGGWKPGMNPAFS